MARRTIDPAMPTLAEVLAAETREGELYDVLPDGRLVEIPGAGHTVPADQPEAFARAVRGFLEG